MGEGGRRGSERERAKVQGEEGRERGRGREELEEEEERCRINSAGLTSHRQLSVPL